MELFRKNGFNPRGDLGQNFLIDLNVLEFIVREADLSKKDVVLEVGSGTGGMTTFMAVEAGHVVSVEYDTNMFALASAQTQYLENVTLLNCDALRNKNNLEPLVLQTVQDKIAALPNAQFKLIANLPYNIATPIISNLVATELPWERIVATIQLELGERMAAKPNGSKYGALTVWLQAQCKVKVIKRMSPTVFWPRPEVDSAIVKITPLPEKRATIIDREFFHDFVRRLFHHRRKLLRGVVCTMYRKDLEKAEVDSIISASSVADGVRAEQVEVHELVELSNRLVNAIRSK